MSTKDKHNRPPGKPLPQKPSTDYVEPRQKPVYIEVGLYKRLTMIAWKRGLSASALAEIFIGMGVHGEELEDSRERETYLLLKATFERLIKESR